MKIEANNIDDYLEKVNHKELFLEIYNILINNIKSDPYLFVSDTFTGIGYGHTKADKQGNIYPLLTICDQRNNVSLYGFFNDDMHDLNYYQTVFGKSNVGKACIRITKLTTDRRDGIISKCQALNNNINK